MIVECSACGTRFQLDDSRVPETGIRVRCSKCKQAFFLPHPDSRKSGDAGGEAPSPGDTHDLRGDSLSSAASQSLPAQPEEDPVDPLGDAVESIEMGAGSGSADEDDAEADWTFNDGGDAGENRDAEDSVLADSPSRDGSESGSGLELGDADDPMSAVSEFEPFGNAVGLDDDEAGESVPDLESTAPEPVAAAPAADSQSLADIGEDLGSPEDWDFLSDDPVAPASRPGAPAAVAGAPEASPIGALELAPAGSRRKKPAAACVELSAPPVRREFHAVMGTLGWIVTLSLFAAGAARGLLPADVFQAVPDARPEVVEVGRLQAEASHGSWLDTAGHGRVFMVSGELRNPTQRSAVAGAALRVAVYGSDGERLPIEPTFAGVGLSEAVIRESSMSEFDDAESEALQRFAHVSVPGGSSVPFRVLLRELPSSAERFELEVVDAPDVVEAPAVDAVVWREAATRIDGDPPSAFEAASPDAEGATAQAAGSGLEVGGEPIAVPTTAAEDTGLPAALAP